MENDVCVYVENDVCVYVYKCIYVFRTNICVLFMFLIYIACLIKPHNNINHKLTFRFDFSKTCATKGSRI